MNRPILFLIVSVLPFALLSYMVIAPASIQIRSSRGISMLPAYTVYEFTLLDLEPRKIDVSDVVVFNYGEDRIGHRVIHVNDVELYARGDNNPEWMIERVPLEDVEGVVLAHSPAWVFSSMYLGSMGFFFVGIFQLHRAIETKDI